MSSKATILTIAVIIVAVAITAVFLVSGPNANNNATASTATNATGASASSSGASATGNTTTSSPISANVTAYTSNWTINQGSRVTGSNLNGVPSAVQLQNGSVRLYYCTTGSNGVTNIVSSTSKNGLNFTPDSGIRIADGNISVCNPSILSLSNGAYRIYYSTFGANNTQQLYTAFSRDGLNFTNYHLLMDPQNSNWNNASGFSSEPEVHYAQNGTFVMYYNSAVSCSKTFDPLNPPIPSQWVATSNDGVNFTPQSCLQFPAGYDYSTPFSDFDWALLPNGTAMYIGDYVVPPAGGGFLPPNAKGRAYYGFYVAYSTDSTLLHYSTPTMIIKMPWPSGWFSDQDVLHLSNGTYIMYYNLHINESGSQSMVINSATWKPNQ